MIKSLLHDMHKCLDDRTNYIISKISESYDIPKSDLTKLLYETTSNKYTPSKSSIDRAKKKSGKCSYIFMKGVKKDQECGVRVPDGNIYCAKHSIKEPKKDYIDSPTADIDVSVKNSQSILTLINNAAIKTSLKNKNELESSDSESNISKSDLDEILNSKEDEKDDDEGYDINHNKWGNCMDEETLFIFINETTVIGKQDMDNGNILELTLDEQELVEDNGWNYVYQK